MAFSERLAILITADGAGAVSEFRKVGDAADKNLGKAETASARMSAGFTKAGIGMMTTSAVLVAGMWKMGQSAAELEQAVGGTEAVFKDTAGTIDEFAKTAAETTGLSETMARTLTTRLGGALKGLGFETQAAADQAVNLTKIAADLAATYGGTTADAVTALSAAFRGEFDPAEQFNLFLKQSAVDAKAVEMGLAATTTEVNANARAQATLALIMEQSTDAQGQFAREADTVSGQMARSQANFENMKAELGAGFMPVMSKAADVLSTVTGGLMEVDQATGGALSTFTAFSAVGLGVAGVISTIIGKAKEVKEKISSAREAMASWSTQKQAIIGVGGALASVASALLIYKGHMDELQKQAEAWGDQFTASGKTKLAEDGFERLNAQLAKMDEMLAGTRAEAEAWDSSWNPAKFVDGDYRAELAMIHNETEESKRELEAYRDEVHRVMNEHGVSLPVAIAWVDGIKEGGDTATEVTGAMAGYTEAVNQTEKAWSDAEKALKGYLDEQWGLINSAADAEAAIDDIIEGVGKHGLTLDIDTEAGRDNISMLQDLQQSALDVGLKEAEKTKSVEAGIAASVAYQQELANELIARYGNTQAVQDYIAALGLTPAEVVTAFRAAGLQEAVQAAKELARTFGELVTASVQLSGLGVLGKVTSAFGGERAEGGPVSAGQTYLVGEKGPELFTPGTSGSITPNHAMGGGTQTVIVQVDGREIARAIVDRERAA